MPGDVAQEFSGDYIESTDPSVIYEFHKKRLLCLLDAEPDVVFFETVPALGEARIICDLLHNIKQIRSIPPIIISFSCRDGRTTCHGEDIIDCAVLVNNCDEVSGLSVNCTAPQHVVSLVELVRQQTWKIIGCYPNSGEIFDSVEKSWRSSENPVDKMGFDEPAILLRQKGANIVGGCCRTGPKEISLISKVLRKNSNGRR